MYIADLHIHSKYSRATSKECVDVYKRQIKWLSYVFSALLTIFFSIIVNLVMYRKLKKISMVESMKSTE